MKWSERTLERCLACKADAAGAPDRFLGSRKDHEGTKEWPRKSAENAKSESRDLSDVAKEGDGAACPRQCREIGTTT